MLKEPGGYSNASFYSYLCRKPRKSTIVNLQFPKACSDYQNPKLVKTLRASESALRQMFSYLARIRHGRPSSSLISLLARCKGEMTSSRPFSGMPGKCCGSLGLSSVVKHHKRNDSALSAFNHRTFIHSDSHKDDDFETNSRPMNLIRDILKEDGRKNFTRNPFQFPRHNVEHDPDFVHIKLLKNNTFITITDSKGNKKVGASSGSVPELKGGAKGSRYASEATAEHAGRVARNLGLKSVVMKVNGFTFFKKKKQAILSWKEGFTTSRSDQNPIVYIEDTTRRPHNGCRRPKKRRI